MASVKNYLFSLAISNTALRADGNSLIPLLPLKCSFPFSIIIFASKFFSKIFASEIGTSGSLSEKIATNLFERDLILFQFNGVSSQGLAIIASSSVS
jgi:hypothetical protein